MTVMPRTAIRYEFPSSAHGNLSLQWPLPLKLLFQLLIYLLPLGAFSQILVVPMVFKAERGSVGKVLLTNLNKLGQTIIKPQEDLGDPKCSPVPHQGRQGGVVCPQARRGTGMRRSVLEAIALQIQSSRICLRHSGTQYGF